MLSLLDTVLAGPTDASTDRADADPATVPSSPALFTPPGFERRDVIWPTTREIVSGLFPAAADLA